MCDNDETYSSNLAKAMLEEIYKMVLSLRSHRGGSGTVATSKVEELFVIIVIGFPPLTIITKSSTLDVAAVLDPPLQAWISN